MGDLRPVLSRLAALQYRFTTVTPETHALVNARPGNELARTLRDVFGWNRSFAPEILPSGLFTLLRDAGACVHQLDGTWRANFRVASLGHQLFAHSAFPTRERDAVFFGGETERIAAVLLQATLGRG